jgi:hypothetical protein
MNSREKSRVIGFGFGHLRRGVFGRLTVSRLFFHYRALYNARFNAVRFGFDVFVEQTFAGSPPVREEF